MTLSFKAEDCHAIFRLSQVNEFMQMCMGFKVVAHDYDIPDISGHSTDLKRLYIDRDLSPWRWLGVPINPLRFMILREHTAMALCAALSELKGPELQALLIRMTMVNADDTPYEHAFAVATGAVDYAVALQYGASGLTSYHRHMKSQVKRMDSDRLVEIPADLDMTPYAGTVMVRVLCERMKAHA